MLSYVQSKALLDYNETYAPISLSPTQTMAAPSDDSFLKFTFE